MSASAAKSTVVAATRPRRRWHWALALPLGWLLLVVFLAITADWIGLPDPSAQELILRRKPPSAEYLLGTDNLGRDMLSRIIYGARTSLIVGICAPFLGFLVGGAIGMSAGYFRGKIDMLAVGFIDILLAFPSLVLALTFTAYLGQSLFNVTLALGILSIPAAARVSRANTLAWANRDFVLAARTIGASNWRIITREILPNLLPPMFAFWLVAISVIIVAEGALSFLGLGIPAPQPSWGGMIADGREALDVAPHTALIPAAVMFATVLSLNFVGDMVRNMVDPRRSAL
ncbi:ABC transporter permease [Reyranella sp. MMS21-HV4-11]|jgi:peptide/nickel transport system permease protein|uniref:ABC transporter permease n=1 Tax=Reyranella humidisoli TaxID=2849149 RepID=A0ABS6INA4_9HYPH|nr:ABC transporter permease [Reyranella sp. MMS21-HV4-11]MBU8875811.1 ABC transporter permease [Reyranella sp. MMS21-HV4-11]